MSTSDFKPITYICRPLLAVFHYCVVSDPDGVGRLARRFSLSEKDVKEVLRVLHFVLVVRIPVRAYWSREEVLPAAREG